MNLPFKMADIMRATAVVKSSSNVVNVLLLLTITVTPYSLHLFSMAVGWRAVVLLVFAVAPLTALLYFYNFFAKNNPVYLRSETFHFKHQALTVLGDKYKSVIDLQHQITATGSGITEEVPKLAILPETTEKKDESR